MERQGYLYMTEFTFQLWKKNYKAILNTIEKKSDNGIIICIENQTVD